MYEFKIMELKKIVKLAIIQLYKNDCYLIQYGVHETTLCHKLANYIEKCLIDFLIKINNEETMKCLNVDIEYNKNGNNSKNLIEEKKGKDQILLYIREVLIIVILLYLR